MKRTTYIIFGMLLTGLVVVCAGIFYASMQVTGWDNIFLDIKGEKKTRKELRLCAKQWKRCGMKQ